MSQESPNLKTTLDKTLSEAAPLLKRLLVFIKIVIPLIAVWLIWHELHKMSISEIKINLHLADKTLVTIACFMSLLAVSVMGLYDAFAFKVKREEQPLTFAKRWLLGSLMFAWSNLIGFGPAIRAIVYTNYGYSPGEIGRGLTSHYLGSLCGLAAWLIALIIPTHSLVFTALIAALGGIGLIAVMSRLLLFVQQSTGVDFTMSYQSHIFLGLVAFAEWGLSISAFVFIANAVSVTTLNVFIVSKIAILGWSGGLLSMIPGGFGAADSIWINQFSSLMASSNHAGAAVIIIRLVFYILPWILSLFAMYFLILREHQEVLRWQRRLVAGALIAQAGFLLLSTATPAVPRALRSLSNILPLHIVEVSHALTAILAIILLFLVRGISRGYIAAYRIVLFALGLSFVVNLLKGIDVLEAASSFVVALMLFGVRHSFTRPGRIPTAWLNLLSAGFGGFAFFAVVGFLAFKNVPYRPELWTEFAYYADASRFIRVGGIIILLVAAVFIREALRPSRRWLTPSKEDITKVENFATTHANGAHSLLVGGGDKAVWWFEDKGFLLYQAMGDRFLVLKDPVLAPHTSAEEFLKAFTQFCADEDMDPVFCMVSLAWIEHLHEFGFHFIKVSEEAVVDLQTYSLEGSSKSDFRRTIRNTEKQGVQFEVLTPPFSVEFIEALGRVSDEWLNAKGGHELQFSACYFSPAYIARNKVGIARTASGEIIAFVNLLCTRKNGPSTIDLMRYIPGKADNIMDYVLTKTLLYLAEQGYSHFSLGSAPMTEVGKQKHARWLEKVLYKASLHAERIYNYDGLRRYKNKFGPNWQARYLAYQFPWDAVGAVSANARLVQALSKEDIKRIKQARIEAFQG